jgi:acetyl esterase/lipase
LAFLEPLWDVYAGAERESNREDARCHPTLARRVDLPRDLLFVCAGMDILLDEQLRFVERLKREGEGNGGLEVLVVEKGFHGFVECKRVSYPEFWTDADCIVPSWIMERERMEVFEKSIAFVKMVHEKHGFGFDHRKLRPQ